MADQKNRSRIKEKVKQALISLYQLPLFNVFRRIVTSRNITILLYHKIEPDMFESHIRYYKKHYNIVSLRDIHYSLTTNDFERLPVHSLAITFDDGWKSNYELLHIFRKYSLPVTIFLATGLVNTNRRVWNDVIESSESRENNWLKTLSNSEKDKYLFEKYGFFPEKEYRNRSMLNLEEIGEMKHSVDFQSHGVFHPIFIRCSQSELEFELTTSKEWLEKTLDADVYGIAYPYGWFSSKVVSMIKEAGYSLGRTANFPCLNGRTVNPLKLKCVGIKNYFSLKDIERKLARAHINTFLLFLGRYARFKRN